MTEELLFTFRQNKIWYPVRLITYNSGAMDLVLQTGPKHDEALDDAEVLLNLRGLVVAPNYSVVGPSGAYYTVKEKK